MARVDASGRAPRASANAWLGSLVAGSLLLAVVAAILSLWPRERTRELESRRVEGPSPTLQIPASTSPPVQERASDGLPIAPAGSAPIPSSEPHHPHPITPQHERLYTENNLVGSLASALDARDVAGLRRLIAEYRDGYPEDEHLLQVGYELIADCLEHPGPETRAAAQRYYDEQLASNIRRYIRRHCLEPQ